MHFKKLFLFLESIKTNLIWVYHRTSTHPEEHNLVKGIFDKKSNVRAAYGPGLYTTFDLDSQLGDKMKDTYGPYIIRMKVNISNYCILDQEVFKNLHPDKNFWKHVESLKLYVPDQDEDDENYYGDTTYYGSDIAKPNHERIEKLGFNGMIFNGRRDGKVAVVWKPATLVVHSYSQDDGKTWSVIKSQIVKADSQFDNIWMSIKKTGKFKPMPFETFRDFFNWVVTPQGWLRHQSAAGQLNKFLKDDRNYTNLVKLIKHDATTRNDSSRQVVRFQLINALDPIDVWDFYTDFRKTNPRISIAFGERLLWMLERHLVPNYLYDEIRSEISKESNLWMDNQILRKLTGQ